MRARCASLGARSPRPPQELPAALRPARAAAKSTAARGPAGRQGCDGESGEGVPPEPEDRPEILAEVARIEELAYSQSGHAGAKRSEQRTREQRESKCDPPGPNAGHGLNEEGPHGEEQGDDGYGLP